MCLDCHDCVSAYCRFAGEQGLRIWACGKRAFSLGNFSPLSPGASTAVARLVCGRGGIS